MYIIHKYDLKHIFLYVEHLISLVKAEGGLRGPKGKIQDTENIYGFVKRDLICIIVLFMFTLFATFR